VFFGDAHHIDQQVNYTSHRQGNGVGGGSAVGEDDDERNVTIKGMVISCRSESQVKKQVGWWLFRSIEYGG
jgi:hypothetical protein